MNNNELFAILIKKVNLKIIADEIKISNTKSESHEKMNSDDSKSDIDIDENSESNSQKNETVMSENGIL